MATILRDRKGVKGAELGMGNELALNQLQAHHGIIFKPESRYILYCAGGGRSALSAKAMKDMGYNNIAHLEPGFGGWEAAGLDIEDCIAKAKSTPAPKN